jgi:putative ABC transport system substrate-binding protein
LNLCQTIAYARGNNIGQEIAMKRREFIALLGGAAALPRMAQAQQKLMRFGYLASGAEHSGAALLDAIRQGLRENNLIESKDYFFDARWAEGQYDRFPAFARELVERNATVLIVTTIAGARAAQRATTTIPIVMASMNDPVGSGLVASLARPGGNTTGLATLNQDVTPKLLEILHLMLPKAASIAVVFNPANPSNLAYVESTRAAAGTIGVVVQAFELKTPAELNSVFDKLAGQKPDALLIVPDAATLDLSDRIATLALRDRIPILSTAPELTAAGGLVSYGVSRRENYRRSGYFIRKILDGNKPADLPIEQPTKILLSLNLKTAKILGISVPDAIHVRADEVIE